MTSRTFKVAYGIKLFERRCRSCPLVFWVPKSSDQKYCSKFCENYRKTAKFDNELKPKRKDRKITNKVTEEDYE